MLPQKTVPAGHAAALMEISPPSPGRSRVLANRLLFALLALGIMLILKRHYSQASADQLTWILAPTARLVAWLTPARPVFEHGVGHVDFSQGIIIAPACAGINFMIMAFGLAAFCGGRRMDRLRDLASWLVLCLAAAYAYTIGINTLRIALSMYLFQVNVHAAWLTPGRLHRVAGVVLYLGALWLFHGGVTEMLRFRIRSQPSPARCQSWHDGPPGRLPLAWYLTGAVGVPVANAVLRPGAPSLFEHCITVLVTSALFWTAAIWTGRWWRHCVRSQKGPLRPKPGRRGKGCHGDGMHVLVPEKYPQLRKDFPKEASYAGNRTNRGR